MNNKKVLYIGRTFYSKVEKLCKDKGEALTYHYDLVRRGMELKSYVISEVTEPVMKIDRLSHVDTSNQLPN